MPTIHGWPKRCSVVIFVGTWHLQNMHHPPVQGRAACSAASPCTSAVHCSPIREMPAAIHPHDCWCDGSSRVSIPAYMHVVYHRETQKELQPFFPGRSSPSFSYISLMSTKVDPLNWEIRTTRLPTEAASCSPFQHHTDQPGTCACRTWCSTCLQGLRTCWTGRA